MVIDIRTRRKLTEPVAAGDCVILNLHKTDIVLTDQDMLPILFRVIKSNSNNTTKLGIIIDNTFVPLADLYDITYEVIKDYKAHRKDFSPEIAGDNAAGSF